MDAIFRKSTLQLWFVAIALTSAVVGCGGADPLRPAHSPSFFPVRGTADDGSPAHLQWTYRFNDGHPVTDPSLPAASLQLGDETLTSDGSTMQTSLNVTVTSTDGSISGNESVSEADQLTSDSPAAVSARDLNVNANVTEMGMSVSLREMSHYAFGATPLSTFFDRSDLDTLEIGHSESGSAQAAVTATISITGPAAQTQTQTSTATLTGTWTLMDKLPTFQVTAGTYANVVEVQMAQSSVDSSTGTTDQSSVTIWLAKGIGMVREEESSDSLIGTNGAIADELVSTNLVAP
jgi:hypothetical protein